MNIKQEDVFKFSVQIRILILNRRKQFEIDFIIIEKESSTFLLPRKCNRWKSEFIFVSPPTPTTITTTHTSPPYTHTYLFIWISVGHCINLHDLMHINIRWILAHIHEKTTCWSWQNFFKIINIHLVNLMLKNVTLSSTNVSFNILFTAYILSKIVLVENFLLSK